MTTPYDPFAPLVHDDLVQPVHHHDETQSHLAIRTAEGLRPVTVAQATSYVGVHRRTPSLAEVEHASGGPRRVPRRAVLQGAAVGLGGLLAASSMPRYAFAADGGSRDLLVVIFLRGGMDGLSAVAPVSDPALRAARPHLALGDGDVVGLDGHFAMSKHLSALQPLYAAGELAFVVGAGHPQVSRSHFEDQALVEHAAPASMRSGWLARHLETTSAPTGTVRALTRGNHVSMSLTTSAFDTIAMADLATFDLQGVAQSGSVDMLRNTLDAMYADAGGMAAQRAGDTMTAIKKLASVRAAGIPQGSYPADGELAPRTFLAGLRDIAAVANGGRGLEVACLDFADWDMHRDLGPASASGEWFPRYARALAGGLAAFRQQLGQQWRRTTVVTISEFGRRVQENSSMGVDHGHGNVMMVLGGGVKGGRVYGSMPSLAPSNLVLGDVPVTTDYRQVLSEIVDKRLGNGGNLARIFPGFTPGPSLGIVA